MLSPVYRSCPLAGQVDLWIADLDAAVVEDDLFVQLLATDERERMASLATFKLQGRFAAARGILRLLLASYLHIGPQEVRFCYGPGGKPFLATPEHKRLHFNVAHSASMALFGFA